MEVWFDKRLKNDMPVLGLAGCHGRKWKRLSRYVDWAPPIHITVQQMRLRWMETSEAHSIPLLKIRLKTKLRLVPLTKTSKAHVRSFTSLQMFHTHAPLPRGFFMEVTIGEGLLSVPWSRIWLQNTGKEGNELAKRLSRHSWCQSSMSDTDRASICILRACCDKVCVVVAKWLARWAKSSAVKIWHGSVAKSDWSVSIFSRIAALASLSLLRMS